MIKVMEHINDALTYLFIVWLVILLFLSLKNCFLTEGKSRVKLFFLTALGNPFFCYTVAVMCVGGLTKAVLLLKYGAADKYTAPWYIQALVYVLISVVYMALVVLVGGLIAKWLGMKHKAPVLFIWLMFNTIFIFQMRGTADITETYITLGNSVINLISTVITYLSIWLFYRLDVRAIAGMALDDVRVDWRTFTYPPFIMSFLYSAILLYGVTFNYTLSIFIMAFCIVIVFLFIWTFNIIIKNIIATSEALKAKDEAIEAKNEVKKLSVEVMEALAHTIDAKDEYTRGHSVRVAQYSRMIARKLGMSDEECEDVYYMGLLHDLGKIGVPNEIINSPTRLTDEEYAVIMKHPGLGYDILSEIKSRPDLVTGARWHHERYDGKGYPDGKSGDDIPVMARIIAVADSYDAMTSNRSYRKYLPQDKVKEELEKNKGTQFDPAIAETMIAIISEDREYRLHE